MATDYRGGADSRGGDVGVYELDSHVRDDDPISATPTDRVEREEIRKFIARQLELLRIEHELEVEESKYLLSTCTADDLQDLGIALHHLELSSSFRFFERTIGKFRATPITVRNNKYWTAREDESDGGSGRQRSQGCDFHKRKNSLERDLCATKQTGKGKGGNRGGNSTIEKHFGRKTPSTSDSRRGRADGGGVAVGHRKHASAPIQLPPHNLTSGSVVGVFCIGNSSYSTKSMTPLMSGIVHRVKAHSIEVSFEQPDWLLGFQRLLSPPTSSPLSSSLLSSTTPFVAKSSKKSEAHRGTLEGNDFVICKISSDATSQRHNKALCKLADWLDSLGKKGSHIGEKVISVCFGLREASLETEITPEVAQRIFRQMTKRCVSPTSAVSLSSVVEPTSWKEVGPSHLYTPSDLNDSQLEAVLLGLQSEDICCIHGPPGTGKTITLSVLIKNFVEIKNWKVLACAPSNEALNNLMEKCIDRGVRKCTRLGHPSRLQTNRSLVKYCLDSQISRTDGGQLSKEAKIDLNRLLEISNRRKGKRTGGGFSRSGGNLLAKRSSPTPLSEKSDLRKQLKACRKDVSAFQSLARTEVLSSAQVVFCTCAGAGSITLHEYVFPSAGTRVSTGQNLETRPFDVVVIDEAAQALEASCWIPMLMGNRCVLAGDHQQLPPTVKSKISLKNGLGVTLFERLMRFDSHQCDGDESSSSSSLSLSSSSSLYTGTKKQEDPSQAEELSSDIDSKKEKIATKESTKSSRNPRVKSVMLDLQYRMNEDIMEWSNQNFYGGLMRAHKTNKNHTIHAMLSSPSPFPPLPSGDGQPFTWIDTAGIYWMEEDNFEEKLKLMEKKSESDYLSAQCDPNAFLLNSSSSNRGEAAVCLKYLERLVFEYGVPTRSISVITPYKKQVDVIRSLLSQADSRFSSGNRLRLHNSVAACRSAERSRHYVDESAEMQDKEKTVRLVPKGRCDDSGVKKSDVDSGEDCPGVGNDDAGSDCTGSDSIDSDSGDSDSLDTDSVDSDSVGSLAIDSKSVDVGGVSTSVGSGDGVINGVGCRDDVIKSTKRLVNGVCGSDIGSISSRSGDSSSVGNDQRHLRTMRALESTLSDVAVNTVDSFQGRESDVVILSLVRSNLRSIIGFLRDYRRMNVAVTRAKRHLVVIGNSETIAHDDMLSKLYRCATERGDVRSAEEYVKPSDVPEASSSWAATKFLGDFHCDDKKGKKKEPSNNQSWRPMDPVEHLGEHRRTQRKKMEAREGKGDEGCGEQVTYSSMSSAMVKGGGGEKYDKSYDEHGGKEYAADHLIPLTTRKERIIRKVLEAIKCGEPLPSKGVGEMSEEDLTLLKLFFPSVDRRDKDKKREENHENLSRINKVYSFRSRLLPFDRMLIHSIADELKLYHISRGSGASRHIVVSAKPPPPVHQSEGGDHTLSNDELDFEGARREKSGGGRGSHTDGVADKDRSNDEECHQTRVRIQQGSEAQSMKESDAKDDNDEDANGDEENDHDGKDKNHDEEDSGSEGEGNTGTDKAGGKQEQAYFRRPKRDEKCRGDIKGVREAGGKKGVGARKITNINEEDQDVDQILQEFKADNMTCHYTWTVASTTTGCWSNCSGRGEPDIEAKRSMAAKAAEDRLLGVSSASSCLASSPPSSANSHASRRKKVVETKAVHRCRESGVLGQLCSFCGSWFCLKHIQPEVHGCGDLAKKDARLKFARQFKAEVAAWQSCSDDKFGGSSANSSCGAELRKTSTQHAKVVHECLRRDLKKKLEEQKMARSRKDKK